MKIYNIINIPKGLSPEVECECREEYLSGYTAGYEDGKNKGFQSGYTSGVTDGIEEGKEEQKSLMVYTAITENGTYSREDGYNEIFVDVPTYSGGSYESGYTSGYTDGYGSGYTDGREDGYGSGYTSGKTDGVAEQKAKLVATAVTSNGTYSREDGFSSVSVNVAQTGHTDEEMAEAFSSGKTAGVDEQKAKLVTTAFTANGTFSRPDGFSSVYVNVPQTGQTINNQTKNVNISQNGSSTVTHDSNYTGLEYVTINVNVPQTGHTDEEIAAAYASGITHQKSLLAATAFTGNGTFTKTDGWSAVTVNVSGYTQEDLDNAFRSGYTSGITDGYGSGWTDGYASGYTDGYADASGETQSAATELSIVVPSAITGTGRATVEYQPSSAILDLVFTSSDPNIATVSNNGRINVISAGTVNICVEDRNSGLYDCETVTVEPQSSLNEPLTVNVLSAGTILWVASDSGKTLVIEYQKNGGDWTSITSTTAGTPISVAAGDVISLRGDNSHYTLQSRPNHLLMQTGRYQIEGNIMSLIDSTNYASVTSFEDYYSTFDSFFKESLGLIDASKLLLPATGLANNCYSFMFYGCTNLTSGPAILPATTLAGSCYKDMFEGCTSLTSAPELPATTLATYCYQHMFYRCRSLITIPELPATTLARDCYYGMFRGCTSLTTAPVLPAETLEQDCYGFMFNGCTGLTTAPALPATTLAQSCYSSMFESCTSLTTAPALPATALTIGCYQGMFNSCTSLTSAPELTAPILPTACYSNMFYNCRNLNYIKCLAITFGSNSCQGWTGQVASSGTFVKDPNVTWATGTSGIPNNWTVIDVS